MNISIGRFILNLWMLSAAVAAAWAAGDGSGLFPSCPITPCPGLGNGRELFADPAFSQGFRVSSCRPWDQPNELGNLIPEGVSAVEPPVWRLAQWHGTMLLQPGVMPRSGAANIWTARSETREVTICRDKDGTTLILACLGAREFAGRLRQSAELWPHLLIEHRWTRRR